MFGNHCRRFSCLPFLAAIVLISLGCSSPGDPIQPDQDGDANLPLTTQDRLICEAVVDPEGGTIDLEWFVLDFPPETLIESAIVEVYETDLERPHDGVIVGGSAVHVSVEPVPDPLTVRHTGDPMISDGAFYTCLFVLDRLPDGPGDFTEANEFVDIVAEWDTVGPIQTGNAWADREGNTLSHLVNRQEITLALIDYSQIPELTAEPIFTDDPRDLTGLYARYAQGLEFDPRNSEPLGDRIPIVLIHGLQLDDMDEPYGYGDEEAEYGYESWTRLINALNALNWLYLDFKFYWYCYPTGLEIFGDNGSGASLAALVTDWGENHEPEILEKPLVILAHSMGGLVAREFMQNHDGDVFRLVTVGTPHYGSPIVNIGDDMGFGWISDLLTPGVLDLACDQKITYWYFYPFIKRTCSLRNPDLAALNSGYPENDMRLVCYGGTSKNEPVPPPLELFDYGGLALLRRVTAPSELKEYTGGYHSDCVVPWRSQYYKWGDSLATQDLKRTAAYKYHTSLMEAPAILWQLYLDLVAVWRSYPRP